MTPTDLAAACLTDLANLEEWESRALDTNEAVLAARRHLDQQRAMLVVDGIAGKNSDEREAHLLLSTAALRDTLATAEQEHRLAQMELRIRYEALKTHRALLRALGMGEGS